MIARCRNDTTQTCMYACQIRVVLLLHASRDSRLRWVGIGGAVDTNDKFTARRDRRCTGANYDDEFNNSCPTIAGGGCVWSPHGR